MLPFGTARSWLLAVAFLPLALWVTPSAAEDVAPAPRASGALPEIKSPEDLDRALFIEIKTRTEIMKNLQYLSDVIGPRLTGSRNLERANNWTAERMKEYGLVNVHLEPWEIPVAWERGRASMRLVEPDNGRELTVASYGWSGGTKGKVMADVVVVKAKNKADLEQYKGKLKNAVVLMSPPTPVKPVTDLNYPAPPAPRREQPKEEPKKSETKADDSKKEEQPPAKGEAKKEERKWEEQPGGRFNFAFRGELTEFLKAEGVACTVTDSGKPHGLLNMTGQWPSDRAGNAARIPQVFMVHEHYAMLYRLASRPDAKTKMEVEIENKFIPGPVTVYNTVGEVRGSEKPDEVVVVGAHLDSWDLGTGTTDNGTGSCIVLETARAVAKMAAAGHGPKRTIRFVLFTGEEEGLWGSKRYVERHKDELPKHSAALVHDTGTGPVTGIALHDRRSCQKILDMELKTLATVDGWKATDLRGMGGTDHLSFNSAGVPGFACLQDMDEYRLTHHSQSDTFDKAKEPNLVQGAEIMAVTSMRIANLPELLPRK